ncbi:MAG: hypothetical protein QNJ40_16890 [Xanthomonadales bacterium]|nr:hypothetical protein [Xanthomonadales bacterium]
MPTLIATSVVRGSRQGESHGGVYLVDLDRQRARRVVDWDTMDIDWQGRGWDRGLRGIAFDGERVFVAASDELFVYSPQFELVASYRNPYLKHCHEISRYRRRLYLTSTGFDSILGFDLDQGTFAWGLHVSRDVKGLRGVPFRPTARHGPGPGNQLHLNSVFCQADGMYFSGLHSAGLHCYTGRHIHKVADLPAGTHNARPYQDGVLFNDSEKNLLRFVPRQGQQKAFRVPFYNPRLLTHTDLDDSRIARQGFGRGLCLLQENLVAAGSSPSTITLHDLDAMQTTLSINLSMDVRNAIHGLEVWPYDELP